VPAPDAGVAADLEVEGRRRVREGRQQVAGLAAVETIDDTTMATRCQR